MASITVELLERRNICEPVTSVFLRINNDFKRSAVMDDNLIQFLKGLGRMFYIVDPTETAYACPDLVPKFFRQVRIYLFCLSLYEYQ